MSRKKATKKLEVDVDALIIEVQSRPLLWDLKHPNHYNRMAIYKAWTAIAEALYDNFDEMSENQQDNILKELKTRWKSTRDYFIKNHNKYQATSGASPSKRPHIPNEEQLRFLLPTRQLRTTSGNYQSDVQGEATAMEVVGEETPGSTSIPSAAGAAPSEATPRPPAEEGPGPSQASTQDTCPPSSEDTRPPSSQSTRPPSSQDTLTPPSQPSHRRSRRTLQVTDKQLEVESQALSMLNRVEGNDECDYFSYTLAAQCRQIPKSKRPDFMAFCLAASTVFATEEPLPPVEDFIKNVRITAGRRLQSPRGISVTTQTHAHHYAPPPAHTYPPTSGYYPPQQYVPPTNPPVPSQMDPHPYDSQTYYHQM